MSIKYNRNKDITWRKLCIIIRLWLVLLLCAASVSASASASATLAIQNLLRVHLTYLSDHRVKFDFYFDGSFKKKPHIFTTSIPERLIIDFYSMKLGVAPEDKLKKINSGILDQYQLIGAGERVRVLINLKKSIYYISHQDPRHFQIVLSSKSLDTKILDTKMRYKNIASNQNLNLNKFKHISLNFQDISIRSLLQVLADFIHINMVVSDSVNGNITLHLEDVPWNQALNIIISTRGLEKRQLGNVMLVAPKSEFLSREKQEFDAIEVLNDSSSLHSDIIAVKYAKADELANLIANKNNSLLSKRGGVSVDARTNSIWIQDIETKIKEVRHVIQKLDVPVKQVLIETRIVNVTKDVAVDLGIKWGFTRPDHFSGTLPGTSQTAGGNAPISVQPLKDRLNVDLGASPVIGNPASMGIALASLGANILLDLELSALESENKAEVIASPRVVTSDQQEAYISSGEQIPYQQATSSGATAVSFVQAVLGLRVTPQVTPDGRVLMKLKINQDRASEKLFNGVPAIITREIDTNVVVESGETIVLGGIFQRDKGNNVTRVPFFGNIPGLRVLFKKTNTTRKDEELIIFITPKIITEEKIITEAL